MIKTHFVERVLKRDAALNFVGLDHAGEKVVHCQWFFTCGNRIAREPVCRGEYPAQVVGWMAPFRSQPGVVEIQPAYHRADVERGLDGIHLKLRTRHFRAVWHQRALHNRSKHFSARRIFQRLEAAAERIEQAVARGVVGFFGFDLVLGDVVDNVGEDLVRFWADVGNVCGHDVDFLC